MQQINQALILRHVVGITNIGFLLSVYFGLNGERIIDQLVDYFLPIGASFVEHSLL